MLTMNLTAKEDQPCNPKWTLSKGKFVFRLLFTYIAIIVIVNTFVIIVIVNAFFLSS